MLEAPARATLLLCLMLARPAGAEVEGFGKAAVGGAGGDTCRVLTTATTGAGSFSACLQSQRGPRTIVFGVGGSFILPQGTHVSRSRLTIDGTTAPAPGVTIKQTWARNGFGIEAQRGSPVHDVIVRGIRFEGCWSGRGDEGGGDDLFGLDAEDAEIYNVAIDHCTFTNAADGTIDITHEVRDVTVQWSLFYGNPFTMLVKYGTRQRLSLHHNVWSKNAERNPQLKGDIRIVDFVNNVVHDWTLRLDPQHQDGYGTLFWAGGTASDPPGAPRGNVVNNAFVAVPPKMDPGLGVRVDAGASAPRLWLSGNCASPPLGVASTADAPAPVPPPAAVTTWPATELRERLLPAVGAPHRTPADQAVIDAVGAALARLATCHPAAWLTREAP
jgi:hypothetical protein